MAKRKKKQARLALFDLDHTLLPHDTQLLFCNFVLRQKGEWWRRGYLLFFVPFVPLALLKLVDLTFLKRVFLSYLWGLPLSRLEEYVGRFVSEVVARELHPEVLAEVARHRKEGRTLVLNSASPEFYVAAIGESLGFEECFGTRVRVSDPFPLMPVIEGPNNKSEAKLVRMTELIPVLSGDEPLPGSYAYSDSSADLPMLTITESPRVVDPTDKLREVARERGWKEIEVARHRDRWSMVRQALGWYATTSREPEVER